MIDRTQEDINQDLRLVKLEQSQRELGSKIEAALQLIASQTTLFGQHEAKLKELNPLITLLEHVEAIKEHLK